MSTKRRREKKRNLEHRQEQIMKWWAWSVPRRYWCHDSAITGSFGVDTSYAKILHRHLTSQMGCNRFWRRYVILSMISDFKNITSWNSKILWTSSPDILCKQNHSKTITTLRWIWVSKGLYLYSLKLWCLQVFFEDWPPVDLNLISEKSSLKNQVRWTGFLTCKNQFRTWFLQAT